MSAVIELLEKMGADSSLNNAEAFDAAIAQSELSVELKNALVNKNVTALERQLDVCPDTVCMLIPAEDDDGSEESDAKEE
ncbi:hypothetical protein K0504_02170 [Neiella marina]|uniref:Uncharacterized protein n=1 Tax=Neiella holothuriorum TaxID=2870530 RepID=A0ABS7EBX3_9GAMM|nr:hypothetical protein [Neiella holothuriorum]MBW8189827.1 hypothetical protein [Neiella holothuriorum]